MSVTAALLKHPGVVVVGAGATGLITAIELHRRGVPTLVLERESACAMQSGQCHGWLHRGAVFPDAEDDEVGELGAGADWWEHAAGIRRRIDGDVTGSDPSGSDRVKRLWTRLSVAHYDAEPVVEGADWSVRGGELSLVPTEVLEEAATAADVVVRTAAVSEFLPGLDHRSVVGVRAVSATRTVEVHAPIVVLAAGAGIRRLVPSCAALSERLSFMLVVRSEHVPHRGVTVPEQSALGLMAVPRRREGSHHLLVSNFVSYAATADVHHARTAWLRGVAVTMRDLFPQVWSDPEALWGVYGAVKVERERRLGLGVPGTAIIDTPFRNVLAGVPGKLVLAPVLAGHLADWCAKELGVKGTIGVAPSSEMVDAMLPPASWGPEAWELTPLLSRTTLFGPGEAP